jgi:sugar phosphate isomerase/epimerase
MLGISTFCLHQRPLDEALDRISAYTRRVEVMDEGLHMLSTAEPLESYSYEYHIHAPSRGVNIASLLEPIRKASIEVLTSCFAIAAEVGADVVVHPGYFAWKEEREAATTQFKRSIYELTAAARERSISFYIENMGNWDYFFLRTPSELPLIGDVPLALDVGHAHQMGCLSEFLNHRAVHYHLHDNDGSADSHLPVGGGTIDFLAVMKAVRRNGATPIVEVSTLEGVVESIQKLESIL